MYKPQAFQDSCNRGRAARQYCSGGETRKAFKARRTRQRDRNEYIRDRNDLQELAVRIEML